MRKAGTKIQLSHDTRMKSPNSCMITVFLLMHKLINSNISFWWLREPRSSASLTSVWSRYCCNSSFVFFNSWIRRCNWRCTSCTCPCNLAPTRSQFLTSSWISRRLSCSRLTCSASCILHKKIILFIYSVTIKWGQIYVFNNNYTYYNNKPISGLFVQCCCTYEYHRILKYSGYIY